MQWLGRAVPTDDDVGVTATEHAVGNATEHDGVVATEHGGVAATEHGLSTGTSANSYYRRRIAIGANAAFRSHGHFLPDTPYADMDGGTIRASADALWILAVCGKLARIWMDEQ